MRALANANNAVGVFPGRRIAVTDGAEFLARVVLRKLQERSCTDVTVLGRARSDLSRRDHIERLFDKYRPLLHLATTVDSPADHGEVAVWKIARRTKNRATGNKRPSRKASEHS
jgi:hypothetical protein